jgi:hypothetical protein
VLLTLTTLLVLPLGVRFVVLRHRRRQRFAANRCLSCGYDLRATPERCPECGTPASLSAVPRRKLGERT